MPYQLEHDRVLLTEREFVLEETGELISSLSIWIRFGIVFEKEPSNGFANVCVNNEYRSLNGLIRVSYDSETKKFSFNPHDFIGDNYEVVAYTKDVGVGIAECLFINKEEFEQIIEKYGHQFTTDESLQSGAYSIHKLEEKEIY